MRGAWRGRFMARKRLAQDVYAVILVGGKGKRLRPLSTDSRPKAFLSVTGNKKTMFKTTVDRIRRIIPAKNILVVANKRHSGLVRKDFPDIKGANLILEPVSRNTAPAVALAAFRLKDTSGDAPMVVAPTDQYIIDEKRYLIAIRRGVEFLGKNKNALVTIGVKPTFPDTGLGYIKVHSPQAMDHNIYKVEEFVEKPDLEAAGRYVDSGFYLWNTGVFIFRTNAILKAFSKLAPVICRRLEGIALGAEKRYAKLPNISMDYAIMEKADNVYCVKGAYGWKDMGSFESIKEILRMESKARLT